MHFAFVRSEIKCLIDYEGVIFSCGRLLLSHARHEHSWPPEKRNSVMRLDHAEVLCDKVLLKYKRDRQSF